MHKQIVIALASAAAIGVGFTGSAEAADFKFQFNNALNGGGVVEGFIRGLADEGTSAATSVEVTSNTAGFGIGEYVGNPQTNSWTITGGALTAFNFFAFGTANTSPDVTDSSLFFDSRPGGSATFRAGVDDSSFSIQVGSRFVSTEDIGLSFTKVDSESVPEPASMLGLLAVGIVAASGALKSKAAA